MTQDVDAEDAKLITLARSARARVQSEEAAAVRDTDGRTYVACTVKLPSFSITAMQAAIAAAVSSGAEGIEAAAVVTEFPGLATASRAAVADLNDRAPIYVADPSGAVLDRVP